MLTRTQQGRARIQSGACGARRGGTLNNQDNIPYNGNNRDNQNFNYNHGGSRGYRARGNNGYSQQNTNYHYNQRRGNGASGRSYPGDNQQAKNDNSGISPLWRTVEDRERYAENLGFSSSPRNRSHQESPLHEQMVPGRGGVKSYQNNYGQGNRTPFTNSNDNTGNYTDDFGFNGPNRSRSHQESPSHEQLVSGRRGGKPNQYSYSQGSRTASTNTYNITGMTARDFICGRGRRTPQDLRPSALQLSTQSRSQLKSTEPPLRPVRTSTSNRLGSSDNPASVTVARDLKQEEYDLQAAEYAAKNREKEIQKLQEKMMRLRFCSAYDVGHRLRDDFTRDLSPEARDRMVQKLQDDYNEQAKSHAKYMKEIEKKKEDLEKAKKLEKYDRSPLYKEMSGAQPGSTMPRASESTGAVPKHKADNSSFERKKRHKVDVAKVAESIVKDSPSLNTFKSIKFNGQAVDVEQALKLMCSPSSSTSHVPPVSESVKKPAADWSKYNPTAEDNLREVRRKMQEKLDRELLLKKKEEDKKKIECVQNSLPKNKTVVPLKPTDQKPEDKKKTECVQNSLPKNNTVLPPKSILQKPLTKKKVDLLQKRNTNDEATDVSIAAPTGLQIDFKELEKIKLPGVMQSEAKKNPVLVLRPLETRDILGAKKAPEQNSSMMETIQVNVQEQLVSQVKEEPENHGVGEPMKSADGSKDKRMDANLDKGNIKKEEPDKPCDSTKILGLLDQLKLRALKLEKEYEENFAHQFRPSPPSPDCNKEEKQTQPVSSVKPKKFASQPAQSKENEMAFVPVILNYFQLNEYDKTGILPKLTEHCIMGTKLFTTHGRDYIGQPVLKLRLN